MSFAFHTDDFVMPPVFAGCDCLLCTRKGVDESNQGLVDPSPVFETVKIVKVRLLPFPLGPPLCRTLCSPSFSGENAGGG